MKPETITSHYLQPVAFTSNLQGVSPENIIQVREILSFRLSQSNTQVIAISEDGTQQWIMAINAEGEFVRWEKASRQIIRKFDFYAAYPNGTNFSEDGSRLIASGETIWDTRLGEIIYCLPSMCGRYTSEYNEVPTLLDPTGKIIIKSFASNIDFLNIENRGIIHFLARDCNSRYTNEAADEDVQLFTIDPSATYSAYIFSSGVVCVKSFNEFIGYDLSRQRSSRLDYL